MRYVLSTLLVAVSMSGCAIPRAGYIYSPTAGGRGSVTFPDSADNSGLLRATLLNGERCRGRYSTVPGPQVSWDDEKINTIDAEDTQDGMALLECNPGHLLRCTFTRSINGDGMGRCFDNKNEWLTMYF